MKATGTDDADPASKSVLPSCLPEREPIGHNPVRLRAVNASGESADASDGSTKPKTRENAGKSVSETNSDDGHEPSKESMRDRTQTCNLRFRRPIRQSRKSLADKGVAWTEQSVLPSHLPELTNRADDPALMLVVNAWPELPAPIRAGVVAMIKAATGLAPGNGT